MFIQSILFDRSKNTFEDCIKWLQRYGYKINLHTDNLITINYYRFRQIEPNPNYHYEIKTIDRNKNIKFIFAY